MTSILSSLTSSTTMTKNSTNCRLRINSQKKRTKISHFSIDCWKFKTVCSSMSIIILFRSMMLFSSLIAFSIMFRITSTFIAKKNSIISKFRNKFWFFFVTFTKIAMRLTMFVANSKFFAWNFIKFSTSFFRIFVVSSAFSISFFNFNFSIFKTRLYNVFETRLSFIKKSTIRWRTCAFFFKDWTTLNDTIWKSSLDSNESASLKQTFRQLSFRSNSWSSSLFETLLLWFSLSSQLSSLLFIDITMTFRSFAFIVTNKITFDLIVQILTNQSWFAFTKSWTNSTKKWKKFSNKLTKKRKKFNFRRKRDEKRVVNFFFTFEYDSFVKIILFINCILVAFSTSFVLKTKVFLNIDCTDYSFIDQNLAQIVCDKLDMCFVSFSQSRNVKDFDDQMFFIFIIHVLYSIFIVQNHIEFIIFMLIINLNQH